MSHDVSVLFTCFKAFRREHSKYAYACVFILWGITQQIATSIIGHYWKLFRQLGNITLSVWPQAIFSKVGKTIFSNDLSTSHYVYCVSDVWLADKLGAAAPCCLYVIHRPRDEATWSRPRSLHLGACRCWQLLAARSLDPLCQLCGMYLRALFIVLCSVLLVFCIE